MLGQSSIIGRDLTPAELAVWQSFRAAYDGRVTNAVKGALSMAELLAAAQKALDKAQIFDPIVWGNTRQKELDAILAQYNTLGRIITNADSRIYALRFTSANDFDIIFPGMHSEQIDQDIYPLGMPWILPVAVAVVLVSACVVVAKLLGDRATKAQLDYKRAILDADQQMAKQPADVRDKYGAWKQQNVELIKAAASAPEGGGLLDKLLGAGTGAGIGALIGLGLAAWILSRLPKRTEAQAA